MSQAAGFLGPGGALAEALPGFEHREGQVEMAVRVEETLKRGGALMVEAGTGIGKSFAYLLRRCSPGNGWSSPRHPQSAGPDSSKRTFPNCRRFWAAGFRWRG